MNQIASYCVAPNSVRKQQLAVVLYFVFLLLVLSNTISSFFPNSHLAVGNDYSYLFPAWLDGKIWFHQNGLSIPWFTPSFCAGQPYFADPQSTYYSLPQLLSLGVSPLNVAYLTTLIVCSAMFWGGYLLMRVAFVADVSIALFVATILMLNGFLPHRILVGHTTFHGFALVPWIALFLLMPLQGRLRQWGAAMIAGALVAYWVHSGLGSLLFAGVLAVVVIVLLWLICGGSIRTIVYRGLIAAPFATCLGLSKILAASAFLSSFSRTYYALPGGKSMIDTVLMIVGGLFLPSQSAYQFGISRVTNMQWALEPHEWAYNFSSALFFLAIALLGYQLWQWKKKNWMVRYSTRSVALWSLLAIAALWPLAFNLYTPGWNALLKTIPVINSTSSPLRWVIVYIPLIAIGVGLMVQRSVSGHYRHIIIAVAVVATIGQFATEPRGYYQSQGYDARPLSIADDFFNSGRFHPEITTLGTTAVLQVGAYQATLVGNDTMIAGVSQVFCYNPIFGYRLEKFSAAGLSEDSVLHVQDGHLNLKNPACYVFPKENGCQPGDLFRADQIEEATKFVHYQPFAFAMPTRQVIANDISFGAFCLLVLTLLAWALLALSRLIRKQ